MKEVRCGVAPRKRACYYPHAFHDMAVVLMFPVMRGIFPDLPVSGASRPGMGAAHPFHPLVIDPPHPCLKIEPPSFNRCGKANLASILREVRLWIATPSGCCAPIVPERKRICGCLAGLGGLFTSATDFRDLDGDF